MSAQAASATCSNASLKGIYGYFHGTPEATPGGFWGQMTLDGQGNVTAGIWTENYLGTIYSGETYGHIFRVGGLHRNLAAQQ
jgi:hypothetical protein